MLSISAHDFPHSADCPPYVTISRIEVFVIPALAVDVNGCRICLRLTSDLGYGWSEQFAGEHEPPFSPEQWHPLLEAFLGRFPLCFLTGRLSERMTESQLPDQRAYTMVLDAVGAIKRSNGPVRARIASAPQQAEESVLRQRSVAYLSVDRT